MYNASRTNPEDAYKIRLRELVLTACHFFFFHLPGSFEVKSISVRIGEKFMCATVLIGRNMRSILRQLFSVCSTRVSWPSLFGVFERVCTRIGVKAWGPRYSSADAFHTCQSRQDLPSSSLPSFARRTCREASCLRSFILLPLLLY